MYLGPDNYAINSFFSLVVIILFFVAIFFSLILVGRRNIKVYANKFDLLGIHLIFPFIIFPLTFDSFINIVASFLDINTDTKIVVGFLIILSLIIFYIIYSIWVCIKYNCDPINCIIALLLRFQGIVFLSLIYVIFLGGKSHDKKDKEITPENMKTLNLFDQFRFSLYSFVAVRKIFDKEKSAYVVKNTARKVNDFI
jgi:hypothetical protein